MLFPGIVFFEPILNCFFCLNLPKTMNWTRESHEPLGQQPRAWLLCSSECGDCRHSLSELQDHSPRVAESQGRLSIGLGRLQREKCLLRLLQRGSRSDIDCLSCGNMARSGEAGPQQVVFKVWSGTGRQGNLQPHAAQSWRGHPGH